MNARSAVGGMLAAVVAAAIGELVGQVVPGAGSPVLAVGDRTVALASPGLRDAAVTSLGTADKPVLVAGVVLVVLLVGASAGLLAARRPLEADGVVLVLALLGGVSVATGTGTTPGGGLAVGLGLALAGIGALRLLTAPRAAPDRAAGPSRRAFLLRAGLLGVAAATAGSVSRLLADRVDVEALRAALRLPAPVQRATGKVTDAELGLPGVSPVITPNADFYRIDTALSVPRVDVRTWRLRIDGMVDRPVELSYDDLASMPQTEADITLQCVSNNVGGPLVGNARWQGVLLRDLLDAVGVRGQADQVVGRSVDGFTVGFPTRDALDGRPAMVALGMNGEPLPVEHGFPVRLVVPGLYGYVSATKWLQQIELTTWDAFDAFWVPRGWAKQGPIKPQSRIDVPRTGAQVPRGTVVVAGVAWAPRAGVGLVEVQVDRQAWQRAELAPALSGDTWRQWRLDWAATPGRHTVRVRTTDVDGRVQDEARQPPRPDGATGFHAVEVTVV